MFLAVDENLHVFSFDSDLDDLVNRCIDYSYLATGKLVFFEQVTYDRVSKILNERNI